MVIDINGALFFKKYLYVLLTLIIEIKFKKITSFKYLVQKEATYLKNITLYVGNKNINIW